MQMRFITYKYKMSTPESVVVQLTAKKVKEMLIVMNQIIYKIISFAAQ